MGLIARCNYGCGALIGYEPKDVNPNQNIKCPQCGMMLWVPFNPNYDGVIKDDDQAKNGVASTGDSKSKNTES